MGTKMKTNDKQAALNVKPKQVKDCLFKSLAPSEAIVVNLADGEYYTLNETGKQIWQLIDGKRTVREIGSRLARKYQTAGKKMTRDVERYVAGLKRRGLIRLG
jgi:hypothetical protein